jgi:hypothetical protein
VAKSSSEASSSSSSSVPKRARPDGCGYCSELDHFINDCARVIEDIQTGKCKRNADGRVVLPSGAFVPRVITGKDLRSRIEKWHEQNPGQLAAAQLLVDVAPGTAHTSPSSNTANPAANTHVLTVFTDEQRMEMLLHEMHALRTRAQAKRALESNEEPEHTIQPPASSKAAPEKPASEPAPVATPRPQSANNNPSHPFSKARDAAYAPPKPWASSPSSRKIESRLSH